MTPDRSAADRTAPPRVAVVVLNWRAAAMSLSAVERVLGQTHAVGQVFVVDNGSGDGSAEALEAGLERYGGAATLLRSARNLGFGGGCNLALKAIVGSEFDWVWLLNNDAEPAANCLSALVSAGTAGGHSVGMVGTMLSDPSAPATPHFGSWMHPLTLVARELTDPLEVDRHKFSWLTAASLLISVPALTEAGLFDERYFMYWEDADLNLRVRAAGFRTLAAPDARALHVAGTSSRGMEVQRYVWHFTSQKLFLSKHHSAPAPARAWLKIKFLLKAMLDGDTKRARALFGA